MQDDFPLITTAIPTYRRPHLLRRAIRSVLNQTYPNVRVCVYDNASGDETASVVAEIARADPRVTYHCHNENLGMLGNFAFAMGDMRAPYFTMLSDDDYYYPTFFEVAMKELAQFPEAMFFSGATVNVYDNGQISLAHSSGRYVAPPEGILECTRGMGPTITSIVFRKEILERVGAIDQTIFHWDIEYLLRATAQVPYLSSKHPGLVFNLGDEQSTRRCPIDEWYKSFHTIRARIEEIPGLDSETRQEVRSFVYTLFSRSTFILGLLAVSDKDYRRAHRAAMILRADFGQKSRATALTLLAASSCRFPLFRGLMYGLRVMGSRLIVLLRQRKGQAESAQHRAVQRYVQSMAV
jgi:glycosyltransferase involved in cell wall biosynthesis